MWARLQLQALLVAAIAKLLRAVQARRRVAPVPYY
jgi:hypothetical protein